MKNRNPEPATSDELSDEALDEVSGGIIPTLVMVEAARQVMLEAKAKEVIESIGR